MNKKKWKPLRMMLLCSVVLAGPGSSAVQAEMAADWQELANGFAKAEKQSGAERQRGLAILHAAMFDAANGVEGRYHPYAYQGDTVAGASAEAAVIQAAATVLRELVPGQQQQIQAMADEKLAEISDNSAKPQGVELGIAAATAVLAMRRDDGAIYSSAFTPAQPDVGVYQPTSERKMKSPQIGKMRPFVLRSADQIAVPPPPAISSHQFQRDLAEVAVIGGAESQTDPALIAIANRHNVSGSGVWNGIGRDVTRKCKLSLVEEARTLALLNLALTDALIVGFKGKYENALWRPQTAIHALGGIYEHPYLDPNPEWSSVLDAPMHPEYPCQHCTSGSAASAVLESVFGTGEFTFTYHGKGESVDYNSFKQFAEEQTESRVLGGVHYRTSNIVGNTVGYQIGNYVSQNAMQPVSGERSTLTCDNPT